MSENVNEDHKSLQVCEDKLLQLLQENDENLGDVSTIENSQSETLKDIAVEARNLAYDTLKNFGPHIVNFLSEKNKGEKIYCVTQKTMMKMAKIGAKLLKNSARDALSPNLRGTNNELVGQVDLEERFLPTGNPEMAMALASLSSQMAAIQETLQNVQESIDDIYRGQWNDRFAKVDAAKNELFLAQHIESPERKMQIITNALHLICSGESEITRSLEDEIEKCEKLGFTDSRRKVTRHLDMLIKHIPFLFESWQIKLLLLQQLNELPTLAAESSRIRGEIHRLFTNDRIELLRSQTHSKIPFMKLFMKGNDFWTKEFRAKLEASVERLSSIEMQSREIISYKKAFLLESV